MHKAINLIFDRKYSSAIFVLLFLAALFSFSFNNEATSVVNDALRVHKSIDFYTLSKEFFPLWNPYNLGGMPALADPERFFAVAQIFKFAGSYRVLVFNLMLFALVLFCASGFLCLVRRLGIGRFAGVIATLSFVMTTPVVVSYMTSRIYALVSLGMMLWAIWGYISTEERRVSRYTLPILSFAVSISTTLYYSLVIPLFPIVVFGFFFYLKNDKSWKLAAQKVIVDLIIIVSCGLLISAPFWGAAIYYNLDLVGNPLEAKKLEGSLPDPGSLMGMFFLVETNLISVFRASVFTFSGFALLPAIVLFICHCKALSEKRWCVLPVVFLTVSCFFICLLRLKVFTPLLSIYEHLPIVSHIHQSKVYFRLGMLGLMILVAFGVSSDVPKGRSIYHLTAKIIGVILSIDVINFIFGEGLYVADNFLLFVICLPAPFLVLYVLQRYQGERVKYIVWIALVALQGILTYAFMSQESLLHIQLRGELSQPFDAQKIAEDQHDFRVLCFNFDCMPVGANHKMSGGYSNRFEESAKMFLSALTGDDLSNAARANRRAVDYNCKGISQELLSLSNIKYIECGKEGGPLGWKKVGRSAAKKDGVFYENLEWQEKPYRLYRADGETHNRNARERELKQGEDYTIKSYEFFESSIRIAGHTMSDTLLVLPEYCEKHWVSLVNGKESKVECIGGIYRGILIPKGAFEAVFKYEIW